MREKYESLSVTVLREVAKARGLKHLSGLKKRELVELMLQEDEKSSGGENEERQAQTAESQKPQPAEASREEGNVQNSEERKAQPSEGGREERRVQPPEGGREERRMQNPERKPNRIITADGIEIDNPELDSGVSAHGILEVMPDGYGFIRCENYLPGDHDVYVSPSQIRKFGLKTGDIIHGNTRVKTQQEKFSALLYIKSINGNHPSEILKRPNFEDLTPIFPNSRIRLETDRTAVAMRIMDIVSPIGKGQRGMIVSQPKAGKTTLLKQVAKAVTRNNPQMHLIILLIDERPEEVTDIKEAIEGKNVEVIYSTFDELPEHHKRVSEMVIERARRLVEHGKDVMILLDSITRLARAYLSFLSSGRTHGCCWCAQTDSILTPQPRPFSCR